MERVRFYLPARVRFGAGILQECLPEAALYGKSALIVCGRNFARSSGTLDRVRAVLDDTGLRCTEFADVSPEPDISDCIRAAEAARVFKADLIVALGGGSALDAGKVAAVLATNSGDPSKYFGEEKMEKDALPVVAVPTTCGSGSEVTRYAVIIDPSAGTKKTVSSERIIPKLAILDSDLLATLPARLIAGTGMDAFAHAVEGYLSIKSDSFTRLLSRESVSLLLKNLPPAVMKDRQSLDAVFLASLYAGFVINHTGTIFVHGMAYGLTIRYRLHHGTANALCLPYALSFLNAHGYGDELGAFSDLFTADHILDFTRQLGLPTTLAEIGATEQDIPVLARDAVKGCERSFRNMKIKLNEDDFIGIFSSMFQGKSRS